nr:MAG TPA_asm: hypothetical protein [Caudoviricetes sp.]
MQHDVRHVVSVERGARNRPSFLFPRRVVGTVIVIS